MNKAEDLDDSVRSHPIYDEVTRAAYTIRGRDKAPSQAQRKRPQTRNSGQRLRPGKAWSGTNRGHGDQDQLVVADGRVEPELPRAVHDDLINAVLGVPNKTVEHYPPLEARRACNRPMMRCSRAATSSGPEIVV